MHLIPKLFLDEHLSILNSLVSLKIYNKHYDFDFFKVNFRFLDDDVPCSSSHGVYISLLIWFARLSNHVTDVNNSN